MNEYIQKIIVEAGELSRGYFGTTLQKTIKSKETGLVTEADIAVSDFFIERIHADYPDHAIKTEESQEIVNDGADWEWVIDPIDATSNFACEIPMWSIIVSVLYKGETMYGAVYNPTVKDLFFAEKGNGATRNGKAIRVSDKVELSEASVHACFNIQKEEGAQCVHMLNTMMNDMHLGNPKRIAAVLGMCYVAAGCGDLFYGNGGYDHDYLATALICREAGAMVTDVHGKEWTRHMRNIVVANPALHDACLTLCH